MIRLFTILIVAIGAVGPACAERSTRPNIMIILADDLGSGDLACLNPESKIATPNFDRLASQSIRFNDAHSPSSVCTPTRYALLTGRYSWRSRLKRGVLVGDSRALIEPGRWTIASMLQELNYDTMGIGKWHLGLTDTQPTNFKATLLPGPLSVGFDHYFGIPASLDMTPYVYFRDDRVVELPTDEIARSAHRRQNGGGFWRGGAIAPGFRHDEVLPKIEEEAVSFLESRSNNETPFFLYVPLSAPHTPWLPLDDFRGKSGAGYYGDFVMQVDATLGAILGALEESGKADNTLLIVTSDNGAHWPVPDIEKFGHAANASWRGQKSDIHEGGHRIPFFVRWPGEIEGNTTCATTTCFTDLMATIASVVGQSLPDDAGEDSFDLAPLLFSEADSIDRAPVIHHSGQGMFAIRDGDWKLIEGLGSGGFTAPRRIDPATLGPDAPLGQLYNLRDDPAEEQNLWIDRPEVVARLSEKLESIRTQGRSRQAGE